MMSESNPKSPGEVHYMEDLLADGAAAFRQKALETEFKLWCLGYLFVVAMSALAGWWVWVANQADLVAAQATVKQMEQRILEQDKNAQDLRAMYRLKFRHVPPPAPRKVEP